MASKFWILSNEDPKSKTFRENWKNNNTGEWKNHGNLGWNWFPVKEKVKKTVKKTKPPVVKEETKSVFSLF